MTISALAFWQSEMRLYVSWSAIACYAFMVETCMATWNANKWAEWKELIDSKGIENVELEIKLFF